jgi:hypothetical protein
MRARFIAPLLFASSIAGCQPEYGSVRFERNETDGSAHDVVLRSGYIELPAGLAIVVNATPVSSNAEPYDSDDRIDFYSQNTDVFDVFAGPSRRQFVFVGVAAGSTCVQVILDGREEECIDVTVLDPL